MNERSRAQRLVEVAGNNKKKLAIEIAAIGLTCLYLKSKYDSRNAGEESPVADKLNAYLPDNESTDEYSGVHAFVHTHTPSGELTPFNIGIIDKTGIDEGAAEISGVVDLSAPGKKLDKKIIDIAVSENMTDDLGLLNNMKVRMIELRDSLIQKVGN